jgi:hypothetical protein
MTAVSGAVIIVLVLVVLIPVAVIMTGALVAALLGWTLKESGEEGANDELIELS